MRMQEKWYWSNGTWIIKKIILYLSFYHPSPVRLIVPLKFITLVTFDRQMGWIFIHSQMKVVRIMSQNITLLCVTILKLSVICYKAQLEGVKLLLMVMLRKHLRMGVEAESIIAYIKTETVRLYMYKYNSLLSTGTESFNIQMRVPISIL